MKRSKPTRSRFAMRKALELARITLVAVCGSPLLYGQNPPEGPTPIVQPAGPPSDEAIHPAPGERNPRYRINRSDVLMISFALSPEFDQKVTVQPDGYITLHSIGSVNVLGLTVPQTVDAIKKAYEGTLHNPIVDVDLLDFQRA